MNNPCTVDLHDRLPETQIPATGFWNESYTRRPDKTWSVHRIARIAGLLLPLAVSPVTAMPDPWLIEKRRRDTAVTMSIFQEVIGRFISRSEALQIARQILEEAERERLAYAEFEAARGIQWGDEP